MWGKITSNALSLCLGNQPSEEELIKNVAAVVSTLPEEIITVMRFLFKFISQ